MSYAMEKEALQNVREMSDNEVAQVLGEMSQAKIKELSKKINNGKELLYPRNRDYKNRNVREVFFNDELRRFVNSVRSPSVRCAFLLQYFYALRVSEISRCEWKRDAGVLVVDLCKTEREQRIPVHGKTDELLEDLGEFQDLSSHYLRKCFRRVREDVGLDMVYGESSDGRSLYNFTTHSLRKTSATVFMRDVEVEMKMKEFLGHSQQSNSTQSYHGYWQEEYREDLESAFDVYYQLI